MADYDEDDDETIASSALDDTDDDSSWESLEEEAEEGFFPGGRHEQEAHPGDGGGSVAAGTVEGMRNRGEAPKRPSSYRGVCRKGGRWQAAITANGSKQHLGTYNTEEEAARAYDDTAKQLHDIPILNFLSDGSLNPDRRLKPVKAPKRPSTYRGVNSHGGRWRALIRVNGSSQHVGMYGTEEEAARAYDEKAKQLRDRPILNFLPDGLLNPDRKKNIGDQSVLFREQLEGTQSGDINQVEEDAVTIGVKGEEEEQTEDESGQGRPRKRGRWGQQQEWDEVTVGIKTKEE